MPAPSWRDKFRDEKGRVKKSASADFKSWYSSKKLLSKGAKTEDGKRGKKASNASGRPGLRKAGGGGSGAGGKGGGKGAGAARPPSSDVATAVEHGATQGASADLVKRLVETKLRLMANNKEGAQNAPLEEPAVWQRGVKRGLAEVQAEEAAQTKTSASTFSKPVVREQAEREEIWKLNQLLAEHAKSRDLQATRETLAKLEEKGWANGHSYAAAVHALCRCGDFDGADAALERGDAKGLFVRGTGAVSGVIARTSLLKGLMEGGRDFARAAALFQKMESERSAKSRPNTRTCNTFLRGCLALGAVVEAEKMLVKMEAEGGESFCPDASSYETVVVLLCEALRPADAQDVAERSLERLGASPGSAAMFVGVARAAAVRGDLELASSAVQRARALLKEEKAALGEGGGSEASGSGGKRGKKAEGDKAEGAPVDKGAEARARSLKVFQEHRRAELQAEAKEVETFVRKGKQPPSLASLWQRTVAFERLKADSQQGPSRRGAAKDLAVALRDRLCQSFGLPAGSDEAQEVEKAFEAATKGGAPPRKRPRRKPKTAAPKDAAEVPEAGAAKLDLRALLKPAGKGKAPPVRLEVCSGGGEWLCAQAHRDKSITWVACELRFDRAARCFQRIALRGCSNAGLIAGDARDALLNRLEPKSCSALFVNHPEPPHQTDLTAAAQTAEGPGADTHLLTASFLRDACGGVLRPGGTLTICTDNLEYGKLLLSTVASKGLAKVFEDAWVGKAAEKATLETQGKVSLRSKSPPEEVCGAAYEGEDGASYFQRLKYKEQDSRGQQERRYFLCLRRLK